MYITDRIAINVRTYINKCQTPTLSNYFRTAARVLAAFLIFSGFSVAQIG